MVTYEMLFAFCMVIIGVVGATIAAFSLLIATIALVVTIYGHIKK